MLKLFTHNRIFIILNFIVALNISIMMSYTLLSPYFSIPACDTTIKIIGTAKKNQQSYGTDIRILDIKIDGEPISFHEFQQEGNWQIIDGSIFSVLNPASPASLTYTVSNARILEIEFQKQEGSGIVQIQKSQKNCFNIDLYSPELTSYIFTTDLTVVSLIQHLPLFGVIFLFFFYVFTTLPKIFILFHSDRHVKRLFKILLSIYLLFLGGCVYYNRSWEYLLSIFLMLGLGICSVQIYNFTQIRQNLIAKTFLNGILMIITSSLICYHVTAIIGTVNTIGALYLFENIVIYTVLQLLLYLITRKIAATTVITFCLTYSYAIINYYVIYFRGSPIIPADFFIIRTARNVALNYQPGTCFWP